MNSYAVWNTMQEIKTLGFFQLVILGDFSFFFFLAQFSSQTSTKGRPEHSDNFRGSFYFFFFQRKRCYLSKNRWSEAVQGWKAAALCPPVTGAATAAGVTFLQAPQGLLHTGMLGKLIWINQKMKLIQSKWKYLHSTLTTFPSADVCLLNLLLICCNLPTPGHSQNCFWLLD